MSETYPKRDAFHAHRLVRLMIRVCAAQEIGSDGVWLVTIIAHTEDAKRYSSAVTFWNDQLMSVGGLTIGQLSRARDKAVRGGWLHYEPGGKGKVGRYWTTVPAAYRDIPDGSTECDANVFLFKNEQDNDSQARDKRKTNDRETETFLPTPGPAPTTPPQTPARENATNRWGLIGTYSQELLEAIDIWQQYQAAEHGKPAAGITLSQIVAGKRSGGWDEEKIVRAFRKSVEWRAKHLCDPDDDFSARRQTASTAPRRRPHGVPDESTPF